ncbi:MAG: transcriptional coactivator p15/PC4 family protein [Cyanobacteriota bacterium]
MAEKILLGVIERNATEELQIAINEYKSKKYVDLRIFYTNDEGDTWNPTKKGVTVAPDKIDEVIEALEKAKDELGVGEEEDGDDEE